MRKPIIITTFSIITSIILIGLLAYFINAQKPELKYQILPITNYDECVAAGNPVIETYPEKCTHKDKTFTRDVGNKIELEDQIQVDNPFPGEQITSPLLITGQARGTWFFEASFPVRLEDSQGNVLSSSFATAQGEWMTEDFVPFAAALEFNPKTAKPPVKLILQKDNPSSHRQLDNQLIIPVVL